MIHIIRGDFENWKDNYSFIFIDSGFLLDEQGIQCNLCEVQILD